MQIQLSDHFTYRKLFRYVLPSILMMLFTSTYSIVDGFFVSNFVGKTAFAAVNLIMPLVLAWYIITELGSILENAVKMGAKVPQWLIKLLKASANIVEAAGEQGLEEETRR